MALQTQTSVYSLRVPAIDGSTIDFGAFHSKKILIINIAVNSDSVFQYGELEQLYQKYKDSLVIIACPSSNFTGETYSNEDINEFIINGYNTHYLITSKLSVDGVDISPLYQWLTDKSQNGALDSKVKNDFQKYLIDGNGNLVGVFDRSVSPISKELEDAILAN